MNLIRISQYSRGEVRDAQADSPRRVAFQFDHLVRAVDHLLMQAAPLFLVLIGTDVLVQIAQPYASDVHSRPYRY